MKPVNVIFLSQEDVRDLNLSNTVLKQAISQALIEHANDTIEMPPKPGIHPSYENTFIHAMPAYLKEADACGIKWVAGFPNNYQYDLPNISGLIILNDPHTGIPLAIMDCRWITTVRTAIVSAIAAEVCTNPNPTVMALIGCGLQGRYHIRTLTESLPTINTIRYIDVFEASMTRLANEAKEFFNGELIPAKDAQACVTGADIVITCTPGDNPIIEDSWFKPGATAVGIEGGCAWHADALHNVDKFIVDDIPQAKYFEKLGDFPGGLPNVYAELGDLVAGHKQARAGDQERIIVTPLGLAIEDIAIAQLVYNRALSKGCGLVLPLMTSDL